LSPPLAAAYKKGGLRRLKIADVFMVDLAACYSACFARIDYQAEEGYLTIIVEKRLQSWEFGYSHHPLSKS